MEAATIALARFDERLRRAEPVLAEGFRARAHVFESQALVGLSGGFARLEQVVLHDANMATHLATRDIVKAGSLLALRSCHVVLKAANLDLRAIELHSI